MPVGSLKNTLYGLALPVLGKRAGWKKELEPSLEKILLHHHVIGTGIQLFENGKLTQNLAAGYAAIGSERATEQTFFRTASIAKMVTALLVFRMQTLGKLSVQEDVSDFLGYPVRNPAHPDAPVTLGMLLSHTASMLDSPAYFASFARPVPLQQLLNDPQAWLPDAPGMRFRYSNLAAGMIGCMLEKRFGLSFEQLMQQELFAPLGVQATFDLSTLRDAGVASSYRVLPFACGFDAEARKKSSQPIEVPDPQLHYLLASGNLYLTAQALASLALVAFDGKAGFLDERSLGQLHTPVADWPQQAVQMRHGMGLFRLQDDAVCSRTLWGHQGFAYGAVNGVFFDENGSGFVSLNSGASEQRIGHLSCLNRDLIRWWMKEGR